MPASLSFKKNATDDTANLSEVKVITLTDGPGNKYTLDSTGSSLKLKYKPQTGNEIEYTVDGLVKALGDILGARDDKKSILVEELGKALDRVANDANDKVYGQIGHEKIAKDFLAEKSSLVKTDGSNATKELATAILTINGDTPNTSVLKEKVADKDVVKAIFSAKEQPADTQSILATKVADKGVAGAILNAQDGQKSVLVETLGGFLDKTDAVYGNSDPKKVAKDFLAEKGLKPTPAELAGDSTFANAVAIEVNSNNPGFQGSVREVMSKPVFEIPADDNAPLSWDW